MTWVFQNFSDSAVWFIYFQSFALSDRVHSDQIRKLKPLSTHPPPKNRLGFPCYLIPVVQSITFFAFKNKLLLKEQKTHGGHKH